MPRRDSAQPPTDEELKAEVEALVTDLRALFYDRDSRVLLAALGEMYGRVASACIDDGAEHEQVIATLVRTVRGYYFAAHGGPFRPC